ncbi:hypothetical protein AST12_00660 [Staphylococcus succinus]|nr:hypothetical protein AST12_00660 [Staphylococcus succinus]
MELLLAIIIGLLLGLYFHKRKAPMTVNTWFKGLFVILIIHFERIETIMGRFDEQQRKTWERS